MAEHTPTPWTVAHRKGQGVIRGPSTECLAALPYAPCEGYGLMDVFEVGANAAFIVKAVNNHEALVKALTAACGYMRNASIDLSTGCTKATAIRTIEGGLKQAEAVLAAVGTSS